MLQDLMKDAGFPQDAIEELLGLEERLEKEDKWNRISDMAQKIMDSLSDKDILVKTLKETESWEEELGIHRYTLDLLVLLCCWQILEGRYRERNLSMEIFTNSLRDLEFKRKECQDVYGVNGIFVGFWYDRFFDISRFALGRLQFELIPYPFEKEYTEKGRTVRKGDTVINVHIPSDGPLRKEDADAAFQMAEDFYRGKLTDGKTPDAYISEEPAAFMMESWLLDPDLMNLLPEGNLKNFVERFTLLTYEKAEQFEDGWRVFQNEWKRAPEELPRRTKLQKAIADYLQKGGKLGEGYGIFVR